MQTNASPADAILVITGFRARLLGIDLNDPEVAVGVSSPEQVLDAVREWIESWVADRGDT
jgi:hypothetical protein